MTIVVDPTRPRPLKTATGVSGEWKVVFSMGSDYFYFPSEQVTTAGEEVFFSDDEESSYFETAEILSDESFMRDVREGVEQMKRGKTVSWQQIKKELGL